ncbi:MAG: molybdenum cofactor guanylyltransferase [Candidatus Limnocylindria bacterium]
MSGDRIGALVLAGGRSARFGRDKLAEPIDGTPLLDHAVAAVRAVADETVVVVAPGAIRAVPDGVRLVHDPSAFEGPLAGVAAGLAALAALAPDIDRVIVVGGDMPTLRDAVLDLLLDRLEGPPRVAAALLDDGGPLPMAIRADPALEVARTLLANGERRLRQLPARLDAVVVGAAEWRALDPDAATLRDVDEPGDLPPSSCRG